MLTISNKVCEAAPRSVFWAPSGLNELPEVRFVSPFILIGKPTLAFFNRPVMVRNQILGTRVGTENQDFGAVWQTDRELTRV